MNKFDFKFFEKSLNDGFVFFSYEKVDGSMRLAVGTRNHDEISSFIGDDNNGKKKKKDNGYVGYFDLSVQGFRQFNKDKVMKVFGVGLPKAIALIIAYAVAFSGKEFSFAYTIDLSDKINTEFGDKPTFVYEMIDDYCKASDDNSAGVIDFANKIVNDYISLSHNADKNTLWCYEHNGGRGLNGVMLSAGMNGGSGTLGWPSAGEVKKQSRKIPIDNNDKYVDCRHNQLKNRREQLLAEWTRVKTREEEILKELFDIENGGAV